MAETSSRSELAIDEGTLDEQSSRRTRRRVRMVLEGGAFSLFAIFLARLLAVLLEGDPLNLKWQSDFVDVLVNQGQIAFLGFVLLHLASFIQPKHDNLRRRLRLVRTLAVIPVVGYLFLIPLQIVSSYGESSAAHVKKVKYLSQSTRLTELREAITQAQSVLDMDVRLQSLLEPALTSDQLNQSLPVLRQSLLKENEARQKKITRQLQQNNGGIERFGVVFARLASAFGWALAFASGAVPWGARSTLMERLRRR